MDIVRSNFFGTLELRRCAHVARDCPLAREHRNASESNDVQLRCLDIMRSDTAVDWLRAASGNAEDLVMLRRIVLETRPGPVAWLSAHQIIEQIAEIVARRDLCLLLVQHRQQHVITAAGAPAPVARGVTPSRIHPRVESLAPETVIEAREFSEDIEQALQAAALEHAAEDGAPFCEVCEQERQRQLAAAPASRQDDVQTVQAAALERAAEKGMPFCEVCEKERQEQLAAIGSGEL